MEHREVAPPWQSGRAAAVGERGKVLYEVVQALLAVWPDA